MEHSIEQEQEIENSKYLASLVNVDSELARWMLRKHNGDVAQAADALLSGGDFSVESWEPQRRTTPGPMYTNGWDTTRTTPTASSIVTPIPSHSESSVIDLSGDDEELTRAIQMSMEDQSFNEAIQASLNDFTEDADPCRVIQSIREGGRSVPFFTFIAIWLTSPIIQANCNLSIDIVSCLWRPSMSSRYSESRKS